LKSKDQIDLGLTALDELFMDDRSRQLLHQPRIHDIPLTCIDDFPDHPFRVRMDEDMEQLVQSVRERGIITPVTLREKEDGRYELVAGHRRKRACELAGLATIKAEIRTLTRDEAVILMVESNFQRSTILPSEKAFAYKMRLDAMKRQGQRNDLTSSPVGMKLPKKQTLDVMGENSGDSRNQVHRYIRLTYLIPPLRDMVDEGRMAFRPAVELSYLSEAEQHQLCEAMEYTDAAPSLSQAIQLKQFSQQGKLFPELMETILSEEKPNQREKISFRADRLRKYIPGNVPVHKTEEYVLRALEHYRQFQEKSPERVKDGKKPADTFARL
jgi:ParB family chromosome partitioning protein